MDGSVGSDTIMQGWHRAADCSSWSMFIEFYSNQVRRQASVWTENGERKECTQVLFSHKFMGHSHFTHVLSIKKQSQHQFSVDHILSCFENRKFLFKTGCKNFSISFATFAMSGLEEGYYF